MYSIAGRIQIAILALSPFLLGLALILVSMFPLRLSEGYLVTPAFALMPIYFWTLYRPDLMPPIAVFWLGLVQDLLTGGPIGLWCLIYLFTYGFLASQRLFLLTRIQGRGWQGFGLTMAVATLIAWATGTFVYGEFLSPWPLIIQGIVSVVLYPLVARVLVLLHWRIQQTLA
jgi:rod shape-determining protein MreD